MLKRALAAVSRRTGRPELHAAVDASARQTLRDQIATDAVLAAVVRENSNTIDIGAHVGQITDQLLRLAPRGRHIAYEPIPELASRLADRLPNVDVRQAAVSDEAGSTSFVHYRDAPAWSGLRRRPELNGRAAQELTVRTERLDDALPDGFAPSFIKIDVEGAELQVLRGAQRTLSRFQPTVLFEYGGGAALYPGSAGDLWDLVDAAGLRILALDGEPYDRAAFAESAAVNFLAVPRRLTQANGG